MVNVATEIYSFGMTQLIRSTTPIIGNNRPHYAKDNRSREIMFDVPERPQARLRFTRLLSGVLYQH